MRTRGKETTHVVIMIAFSGAALLDVSGPLQVFSSANTLSGRKLYDLRIASLDGLPATTDGGVRLLADLSLRDKLPRGTLIVPGGDGVDRVLADADFIAALKRRLPGQQRVVSVCSGSLLLACTGILDGRPASCHWSRQAQAQRLYPKVAWALSEIYTNAGHIYTSAGVTTGIDLALHLVETDHGEALALSVARELIVYLRRSGSCDQFSVPLRAQFASSPRIRAVCGAILAKPQDDWRVPAMAAHANMTERSLHRHFLRELGVGPARFVESVRLDIARTLVEQGNEPLDRIAQRSGFGDAQNLRRAFVRIIGATPGQYQKNQMDRRLVRF